MQHSFSFDNAMTRQLGIEFPLIMAPMFLVSNEAMMRAGMESGIMSVFPSLNYRSEEELEQVLQNLSKAAQGNLPGSYGVNLIVQKSNIYYKKHLELCCAHQVPFYITSLGNPKEVIERAHAYGAKVYCDVTNLVHAEKCYQLGCDGFIAVGHGAGGHAGNIALHVLVPTLKAKYPDTPVIAAGGVATGESLLSVMTSGAVGASVGTRFIATEEAQVSDAYKDAIVQSGMEDIVMTERLSGTPCAIINTPYAKKIGYKQNWFERLMQRNKKIKKYFKMLIQYRGMKRLQDSVQPGSYKNLWAAGQSVQHIEQVLPVSEVVKKFKTELEMAHKRMNDMLKP